jgi:hypothetical protein
MASPIVNAFPSSSLAQFPRKESHSVYDIITSRIIAELERGVVPWRRPWSAKLPVNLCTQKTYRGLNVLTLGSQGFASRFWLTLRQANDLGGRIRKGEHSSPVIYWNIGEEKEYVTRDGETRTKARHPSLLKRLQSYTDRRNQPPRIRPAGGSHQQPDRRMRERRRVNADSSRDRFLRPSVVRTCARRSRDAVDRFVPYERRVLLDSLP